MSTPLEALAMLGRHPEARRRFLETLLEVERLMATPGFDVREQVTGPIVDALHVPGEEIVKQLADGTSVICCYTSKIIRDFVLSEPEHPDHIWEPQTTRALLHFGAQSGQAVIGGAYIGDHAVLLAKSMPPGGRVHCFEPSPHSASLLARNAAANELTNVVVNRLGLWSRDDQPLVLAGEDSHASPVVSQESSDSAFDSVSIDTYGRMNNIESLGIILLDIEGGELEALKGAVAYLSQPPETAPVVIFEIHRAYVDWSYGIEQTEIVSFLASLGYKVFAIRDYQSNVAMNGRLIELVELADIYLEGPPHGFNMLALKRTELLDASVFRIVRGVSPKLLKHRDPAYHAPLS